MSVRSSLAGAAACAAFAVIACQPAAAQTSSSGWSGQITPYAWGVGLSGDIRPYAGAPTFSGDKDLGEVLHDLDMAFFLNAFARNDRLVLFGDLSYSSSSTSGVVSPGIPAEGSFLQRSISIAAGYRAVAEPEVTLDIMGGLRFWHLEGGVKVPLAGYDVTKTVGFTDPIIAARLNWRFSPGWSLLTYGDYGGFDVGSKETAQIAMTVNYQVNENIYVSGGYRYLYVDYEDDGTLFKGSMSGPIIGVTWRF